MMKPRRPLLLMCCLIGSVAHAGAADAKANEKSRVAAIRAGKVVQGLHPRFAAAVRRIDELGGKIEFDAAGNLIGVDLAGDRISAAAVDLPHLHALPHLKKLKLSGGGITEEGIWHLSSIVGLTELSLLDVQLDDAGLKRIAGLPNLVLLSIRRSPRLTDKGLEYLKRLPKLTKLGLLEVGVTDRGLEQIAGITRLELLDLRGCAQVGNPGLKRLAPLKNLKTLRLGGYQINDDSLAIIKKLASLTGLTIDEAAITDAGLAHLAGLPLEEVGLSRCYRVTDEGFRRLGGLVALRRLTLRGIPLTGAGLAHLPDTSTLLVLRLNETGVDDDALQHLRRLKKLTRLELRQTLVTDAAVDHLKRLGSLRFLDVRETRISEAGVKRLAETLPKCNIMH